MVFLILAAQYERWSLPLSVLFALPFGTFGALAAVSLRGMTNDVYFQIGLVTLLGLAAKNAILIVEFAVYKVEEGLSPAAAGDRGGAAAVPADPDDVARVHPRRAAARDLDAAPARARGSRSAPASWAACSPRRSSRSSSCRCSSRSIFERRLSERRSKAELHARDRSRARDACAQERGHTRSPAASRALHHGHPTHPGDPQSGHPPIPAMEANMRKSTFVALRARRRRSRAAPHAARAAGARAARADGDRRPQRAPRALVDAVRRPRAHRLVDEALANNLDLRVALARIEAARANVLLAQSDLYPSVNLRGGASRRASRRATAQAAGLRHPRRRTTTASASDMSYELDLWGKYRSGALAAAQRSRRRAVRSRDGAHAVAAEVANAYFWLLAADAVLVVLEDTRKTRSDSVHLQRDRFEGGIIGELDLRQAEAERSAVVARHRPRAPGDRAARIGARDARRPFAARRVHAWVARGATIEAATAVPQIPAGLPSGLLERRPDVRRVRSELAAADLRIERRAADYFPIDLARRRVRLGVGGARRICSAARRRSGASARRCCSRCSALKAIEANVDAQRRGATR